MKKLLSLILAFLFIFSSFTVQAATKPSASIKMTINGNICSFDQMPVLLNDRVLVPMRGMFEMLGATVTWDPLKSEVSGKLDGVEIRLGVGRTTAYVNGVVYNLDVPSQIVNGRTLIPARFVAEAFGANVNWNQDARVVEITGIGEKSKLTASADKLFDRMGKNKLILEEYEIFTQGSMYGKEYGSIKVSNPDDMLYGTVLRAETNKAPENPQEFKFSYKKFPEIEPLDNLCVKVVFRTNKCDYEMGYGEISIDFKESSTGEVIHSEKLRAGSSWATHFIPVASYGRINEISINFGHYEQTVEVAIIKVINCKTIPLEILPDNVTPYRE